MSRAQPDGAQAAYDVIVVGAGLAGLFAAAVMSRGGARTLVLARGLGGLQLGSGCIDVWGYAPDGAPAGNPAEEMARAAGEQHPLALAGRPALTAAVEELQAMCLAAGYPLEGNLDANHMLPTALGGMRATCLAPRSFAGGALDASDGGEIGLGELAGFRDFYADYAAANLKAAHSARFADVAARAIRLDLPRPAARRDLFATDLARLMEGERYRAEAARLWRPQLEGISRLGLPAVLGTHANEDVWRDLSERLGMPVFEIPLLPPSVPGLRLQQVLMKAIERAGGRVIIGPAVTGWRGEARALGVVAETAGGPRRYSADAVVLATGGFRHGGLEAPAAGQARESVFDLPVSADAAWFAPLYWEAHPYARFGLSVNADMQVLSPQGGPVYENVFAAGGVLAGADRRAEGSREGIDLATGWKAAQRCLSVATPSVGSPA